MLVLATTLPGLQQGLLTESLSGLQWFACIGLALLLPIVVEGYKWIRRRRAAQNEVLDARTVVAPSTQR
jgi:Ca2+-transporting ATPase